MANCRKLVGGFSQSRAKRWLFLPPLSTKPLFLCAAARAGTQAYQVIYLLMY